MYEREIPNQIKWIEFKIYIYSLRVYFEYAGSSNELCELWVKNW